jgi:predicted NACHT family NTPase
MAHLILNDLDGESGRVVHLGMEEPVHEFRHLTFQEYLAARALVDK